MFNHSRTKICRNIMWLCTLLMWVSLSDQVLADTRIKAASVRFSQLGSPVDLSGVTELASNEAIDLEINFIANQSGVVIERLKPWLTLYDASNVATTVQLTAPNLVILPIIFDSALQNSNSSYKATIPAEQVMLGLHWQLNWVDTNAQNEVNTSHLIQGAAFVIDPDFDADGIDDQFDNCPRTANPQQQDDNNNGIGNACDPAPYSTVLDYFADGSFFNATEYHFTCPPEQVINLIEASFDPQVVDSIRFGCAPVNSSHSSGTTTAQVSFGYPSEFGTVRGTEQSLACAGGFITGLRGRSGQRVDQIGHFCANHTQLHNGSYDAGYGLPFGSDNGGLPAEQRCAIGEVLTGAYVYVNNNYGDIEDIKPVCTPYDVLVDEDEDGIVNRSDNCPLIANPNQEDTDNNGVGNVCEQNRIVITAGNNIETLTLSGASLMAGVNNATNSQIADVITGFNVQPGKNVVAVKASSLSGDLQGLLADIIINGRRTGSKAAWKITPTQPSGDWTLVDYDASSWLDAVEYGQQFGEVVNMPGDSPAHWIWSDGALVDTSVYARFEFYDQYLFIQDGGVNSPYLGTGQQSFNQVESFRCPDGSVMTQSSVYFNSTADASLADDINAVSFGCSVLASNGLVQSGVTEQGELGYPAVFGDSSTSQQSASVSCGLHLITAVRGARGIALNDLGYECSDVDQVVVDQHIEGLGEPVGAGRWTPQSGPHEQCPAGYVAVGADVTVEAILGTQIINGISLACSRIVPVEDNPTQSGFTLSNDHHVSLGNLMIGTPDPSDSLDSYSCPLGEVVTDMNIYYDPAQYNGTIKEFNFTCAVLNNDGSVGPVGASPTVLYTPYYFGLSGHNVPCPGGILTGLRGRTDATNIYTMGHFCTDPDYGDPLGTLSHSASGTEAQAVCPPDHAMTGFDVHINDDQEFTGVGVQCIEVIPGLPGDEPPPEPGTTVLAPVFGVEDNLPETISDEFRCGDGRVLYSAEMWFDDDGINGVSFSCVTMQENGAIVRDTANDILNQFDLGYPAVFGSQTQFHTIGEGSYTSVCNKDYVNDVFTLPTGLNGYVVDNSPTGTQGVTAMGLRCATRQQVFDGTHSSDIAGLGDVVGQLVPAIAPTQSLCPAGFVITGVKLQRSIALAPKIKNLTPICDSILDSSDPVILFSGEHSASLIAGDAFDHQEPVCADAQDGILPVTVFVDHDDGPDGDTLDVNNIGEHSITYSCQDTDSNATSQHRELAIIPNTQSNVALRKDIYATRDPANIAAYPQYAVDGYDNGAVPTSAFIGTEQNTQALMIDLGRDYAINDVHLTQPDNTPNDAQSNQTLTIDYYTLKNGTDSHRVCDKFTPTVLCDQQYTQNVDYHSGLTVASANTSARYVRISGAQPFALNEVQVLVDNPLAICMNNSAACSIGSLRELLDGVEKFWGGDFRLNTTLAELQKYDSLDISSLNIITADHTGIDIGFTFNNWSVNAHLTVVEISAGSYELLLLMEMPSAKRSWSSLFSGVGMHADQQSEEFSSNARIIIPLGFASENVTTEVLPVGEVAPMIGVATTSFPLSYLSVDAEAFLTAGVNLPSTYQLTVVPGVNLITHLQSNYLPKSIRKHLGESTLATIDNAVISGSLGLNTVNWAGASWFEPESFALQATIPLQSEQDRIAFGSYGNSLTFLMNISQDNGQPQLEVGLIGDFYLNHPHNNSTALNFETSLFTHFTGKEFTNLMLEGRLKGNWYEPMGISNATLFDVNLHYLLTAEGDQTFGSVGAIQLALGNGREYRLSAEFYGHPASVSGGPAQYRLGLRSDLTSDRLSNDQFEALLSHLHSETNSQAEVNSFNGKLPDVFEFIDSYGISVSGGAGSAKTISAFVQSKVCVTRTTAGGIRLDPLKYACKAGAEEVTAQLTVGVSNDGNSSTFFFDGYIDYENGADALLTEKQLKPGHWTIDHARIELSGIYNTTTGMELTLDLLGALSNGSNLIDFSFDTSKRADSTQVKVVFNYRHQSNIGCSGLNDILNDHKSDDNTASVDCSHERLSAVTFNQVELVATYDHREDQTRVDFALFADTTFELHNNKVLNVAAVIDLSPSLQLLGFHIDEQVGWNDVLTQDHGATTHTNADEMKELGSLTLLFLHQGNSASPTKTSDLAQPTQTFLNRYYDVAHAYPLVSTGVNLIAAAQMPERVAKRLSLIGDKSREDITISGSFDFASREAKLRLDLKTYNCESPMYQSGEHCSDYTPEAGDNQHDDWFNRSELALTFDYKPTDIQVGIAGLLVISRHENITQTSELVDLAIAVDVEFSEEDPLADNLILCAQLYGETAAGGQESPGSISLDSNDACQLTPAPQAGWVNLFGMPDTEFKQMGFKLELNELRLLVQASGEFRFEENHQHGGEEFDLISFGFEFLDDIPVPAGIDVELSTTEEFGTNELIAWYEKVSGNTKTLDSQKIPPLELVPYPGEDGIDSIELGIAFGPEFNQALRFKGAAKVGSLKLGDLDLAINPHRFYLHGDTRFFGLAEQQVTMSFDESGINFSGSDTFGVPDGQTILAIGGCVAGLAVDTAKCLWHVHSNIEDCGFEEVENAACSAAHTVAHWFGIHTRHCQGKVPACQAIMQECKQDFSTHTSTCKEVVNLPDQIAAKANFNWNTGGLPQGKAVFDFLDHNQLKYEGKAALKWHNSGIGPLSIELPEIEITSEHFGYRDEQGHDGHTSTSTNTHSHTGDDLYYRNVFNTPDFSNFMDFNGDGETDLLIVKDDENDGKDWDTLYVSKSGAAALEALKTPTGFPEHMQFGDVNGDGTTDIVSVYKNSSGENVWEVSYNGTSDWDNTAMTGLRLKDGGFDVFTDYSFATKDIQGVWIADVHPGKGEEIIVLTRYLANTELLACRIPEKICDVVVFNTGVDIDIIAGNFNADDRAEIYLLKRVAGNSLGLPTLIRFDEIYDEWLESSSPTIFPGFSTTKALRRKALYVGNFKGDNRSEVLEIRERDALGRWQWRLWQCDASDAQNGDVCSSWSSEVTNTDRSNPFGLKFGDFNGDGFADVMSVSDRNSDGVVDWNVSYNGKDGRWQLWQTLQQGNGGTALDIDNIPPNLISSGEGINRTPDYIQLINEDCSISSGGVQTCTN